MRSGAAPICVFATDKGAWLDLGQARSEGRALTGSTTVTVWGGPCVARRCGIVRCMALSLNTHPSRIH